MREFRKYPLKRVKKCCMMPRIGRLGYSNNGFRDHSTRRRGKKGLFKEEDGSRKHGTVQANELIHHLLISESSAFFLCDIHHAFVTCRQSFGRSLLPSSQSTRQWDSPFSRGTKRFTEMAPNEWICADTRSTHYGLKDSRLHVTGIRIR